jgi:hypothetical protein
LLPNPIGEYMTQKDIPLCAIHFGRAETETQARETAGMMKNCPYTVMYISMGIDVVGVLVLPESKKWWVDLQNNPELLGLSSLQVFFYSRADMHSPWSLGLVQPELAAPPCGSLCSTCPNYLDKCQGCPASRFYQAS